MKIYYAYKIMQNIAFEFLEIKIHVWSTILVDTFIPSVTVYFKLIRTLAYGWQIFQL